MNVSILIILLNTDLHVDSALGCTSVYTSSICSPHDLNLFSNSIRFKHGNYADFICNAEDDSNNANQINRLEWKGNLVDEGVLGNQGGNNY